MECMKKSILSILLVCLLMINGMSVAFAGSEPISFEMNVTQSTESYDAVSGGENTVITGSTPRVEMKEGDYEVFTVDIPQAGDYSLLFYSACVTDGTQVKVSVKSGSGDYQELVTGAVERSSSILRNSTSSFGAVTLPEGEILIKFEAASGVCRFNKFSIELSASFEIASVKANKAETEVTEGAVLPRSTSQIKVSFTGSVNQDTVTAETVALLKGSEIIPTTLTKTATSVEVVPVSTLDYSTEYKLYIDGVTNAGGNYTISGYAVNFATSDEAGDSGSAEITDDELTSAARNAYITGKLIDENGKGVKGRTLKMYYTPLGGAETEEPVQTVETTEGGAFSLNYTIAKGSATGDYGFRVEAEYAEDKNYTFSYDAEAAMGALTQVINVRQHILAECSPTTEAFIGSGADTYISFNGYPKDVEVFNVNIPESGTYAISMIAGTGGGEKIKVQYLLPDVEAAGKREGKSNDEIWGLYGVTIKDLTTVSSGGISVFAPQSVGTVDLEEGSVKIRFAITHSDIHFRGFEIKYLNPLTISGVTANGETLTDGGTTKRGADYFEADFSENVDTTLANVSVSIKDESGKALQIEKEAQNDKLKIYLLESLDYSKNYKLSVSGVKDMFGKFTIEPYELNFTASDALEDEGSAEITDTAGTAEYADLSVSGKMVSSAGKAMSGRNYEIYLKDPSGNVTEAPIASGKSGADGAITASVTMADDDEGGIYTFIFKGDYVETEPTVQLIYISKAIEADIAGQILSSEDAAAVESIFETNEVVLGIDIDADMANVNDRSKVYAHMVGKDVSTLSEIQKLYRASIALETINQAVVPSKVEAVVSSKQATSDLGLDKARLDLLTGEHRESFLSGVIALERIEDVEALSEAIGMVLNKSLAVQFGKTAVASAAVGVTAEAGSGAGIALTLTEAVSDVKKITFKVEAPNALLENASVSTTAGTYTKSVSGNVMTIDITPKSILNNVSDFGKVYLSTESTVQTYDIKLSADILYSVKASTESGDVMIDVSNEMTEKAVTVTTTPKKTVDTPSRPTSSSSSGTSRPVVSVPTTEPTTEPTEEPPVSVPFEFDDLDEAQWAKASVELLLEKGIVSESADNKFNPNQNVKREEFIKMVVLASGAYDETAVCEFTDVSENSWYYAYVASAKNAGIITGRDDGSFGSGDYITRQEMAAIVYRAYSGELNKSENSELFSDDADIADYAKEAVYALKEQNIVNGMGDNLFVPNGDVTRAMAAKLVAGLVK